MVEFANMAFSIKKGHVELDFSKIELYSNFLNTNLFGACFPTFFFFFVYLDASLPLASQGLKPQNLSFFFFFFPLFFFFNPLIASSLSSYFSFSFSFLHMKPFPVSFFLFFFFFSFLHFPPCTATQVSASLTLSMPQNGLCRWLL